MRGVTSAGPALAAAPSDASLKLSKNEGPFDRRKTLDRASKAARSRSRRKRRRAISLYQKALSHEPADPDLHRKLAPLLARDRQDTAAASCYAKSGQLYIDRDLRDRASGVYREGTQRLPRQVDLWQALAENEFTRGHKREALSALLEGRKVFRRRRDRPNALVLLHTAQRIAPRSPKVVLDLALQLARSGAKPLAHRTLDELARARPQTCRRVRARQLRISPGPRSLGRYLQSVFARGPLPQLEREPRLT